MRSKNTATVFVENREIFIVMTKPKHAPIGAAWRIHHKGASRCLDEGCDESAPFLFPQFVSAQKWEHERMNAPGNQQTVASTFCGQCHLAMVMYDLKRLPESRPVHHFMKLKSQLNVRLSCCFRKDA